MLHENDLAIPKKHNLHQTGLLFDNNKLNIAFGLILCYNLKMCLYSIILINVKALQYKYKYCCKNLNCLDDEWLIYCSFLKTFSKIL